MALLKSAISRRAVRNSHSHVVNELGLAIVAGTYAEGTVLPGDLELAERFKVSRTVLRETMKTLSAKGMIVARARVGTKVTAREKWNLFDSDVLGWYIETGVDQAFLDHLCDMRLSFEPFAASLAARHADSDDVAQIRACAERMREAATIREFAFADLELHMAVLHASRNPFMYSVGTLIEAALVMAFTISSPKDDPEMQRESAEAHRAIADRIAVKDAEGAAEAMRHVIADGRRRVEARFELSADNAGV